jgi:hypothetical protein
MVRRGGLLFDTDFYRNRARTRSLRGEGRDKVSRPNSLMSKVAAIHVWPLPYREPEGFVRAIAGRVKGEMVPDYTTTC